MNSKRNWLSAKYFTIAAIALAVLGVAAYVVFDRPAVDEAQSATIPAEGELVALGAQIYNSQCAVCHGVNLEGQPNWRERKPNGRLPAPPHDATGHTWHHDDATLFALTKYGLAALTGRPVETDMPVYDGVLTDREIRAALAYIKSRWPKKIRERQAEMTDRAEAKR